MNAVRTGSAGLSSVAQDYLKVVWAAGEWSTTPVTTTMLALRMGVAPSTVSETVRRLTGQGLLTHAPYGAVELTAEGRTLAVAMVRRHRLIETFLVQELGYSWDEVHDEAEVLEHAVSDLMIDRIDARLGFPDHDPHGDPIPSADGVLPPSMATPLAQAPEGSTSVVDRISDADPAVLRYVAGCGIGLGSRITVLARMPAAGVVRLRVETSEIDLGQGAVDAIWVTSMES